MAGPEEEDAETGPQHCTRLLGHESAVAAFETAMAGGRLHHGWLLSGPRGIGKSSFAHLAARALIADAPALETTPEDPVARRIAQGNEPRLTRLARTINEKTGKLRTQINVEQVRAIRSSLNLAGEHGDWRCVIVDAAEEMNPSAANALLKVLEEPPERVAFFLVSHAPGKLLPTIRSRCRRLDFHELEPDALAQAFAQATGAALPPEIAGAAQGSVGEAIRLGSGAGAEVATGLAEILAPLPAAANRAALHALADRAFGAARPDGLAITADLLTTLAAGMARHLTGGTAAPTGHEALAAKLSQGTRAAIRWAEAAADIRETADRAIALNLDPRQSLLDMVTLIEAAAKASAPPA